MENLNLESVKKATRRSIYDARTSAKMLIEKDIDCGNLSQLFSVLSARDEARGMALALTRLLPKDTDIERIWKDATEVYNLGYKAKDKFMMLCQCYKRS